MAEHRTDSDWITILDRSICAVVYNSSGSEISTGGAWHSGGPYPDDPIYDNDPFVPNADVSIRYLRIKGPGGCYFRRMMCYYNIIDNIIIDKIKIVIKILFLKIFEDKILIERK